MYDEDEAEMDSMLSLDQQFFTFEESLSLSKKDQQKLKKARVGQIKSKCTVCLDHFKKDQVIQILPCHHKFHRKCVKPWFEKSVCCPLCRFDIKKYLNPTEENTNNININNDDRVEISSSDLMSNQRINESANPLLDTSFIQPRNFGIRRNVLITR